MYIGVKCIRPLNIQISFVESIRSLNKLQSTVECLRPLNKPSMSLQKHRIKQYVHTSRRKILSTTLITITPFIYKTWKVYNIKTMNNRTYPYWKLVTVQETSQTCWCSKAGYQAKTTTCKGIYINLTIIFANQGFRSRSPSLFTLGRLSWIL